MKLPFKKKPAPATPTRLILAASPNYSRSTFITNGIDINYEARVGYSDHSTSLPLRGTFILTEQDVLAMHSLIAGNPLSTEPKPIRRRARRKFCKNGHLKDAENTILVGGQPRCRTCYVDYGELEKAKRRAAKEAKA